VRRTSLSMNEGSRMTASDLHLSRVTHSLGARRLHSGIAIAATVGLSLGLGAFAASGHSSKSVEALVAFAAVTMLVWRFGLGAWLAILVLGSVDALPGPELETIEVSVLHLTVSDTLIVVLILTLLFDNYRDGFRHLADTSVRRVLCLWSGALLLLWSVTVARSYVWSGIPLKHAMEYGRDFAFFAFLVPLFAATLTKPRVLRVMLVALAIGVVGVDIADITSVVTHRALAFLVHSVRTDESNGVTRIFVNAQYLEVVAAMLGFGLLLLARERRLRLVGALLAPLSITAIALELTRAQYVGCTVGLAVALIVWLVFNRRSGRFGRKHLARLTLILIVFGAVIVLGPSSLIPNTALSGVESRFSSVLTTLSSNNVSSNNAATSTVAYRKVEASQLEQVLGSRWIFGLGFLDPRNHYVLGIRGGSIRNGDVGVLNAVMTMGVIGALLIYFPLVFILVGLMWRAVTGSERAADSWIAFGIAAWIVSALTSSVTLVSLFSSPGLSIAALALGVGSACLTPAYSGIKEGIDRHDRYSKSPSGPFF